MTTKRIVYTRPDGGMSIVCPAPEFMARFPDEESALQRVMERLPADISDITICEVSEIPTDRTFRDAWQRDKTPSPDVVGIDMEKARTIHMDRIRERRNAKLQALDAPWMRAMGQGDSATASQVEGERQKLRDVPQRFDLKKARTPDELKALWPSELED